MKVQRVEYDSNNSGGNWWLKDEDWFALEAAGWEVDWYAKRKKDDFCRADKDGRWLGALASKATRHGLSLEDAVSEWEFATCACATDAGCPCCGKPHTFTAYDADGKYLQSGPHVRYEAEW